MSVKANCSKINERKKSSIEKAQRAGLQKQLHKTKFCMYHLQGACRFGTECAFAHSLNEIHSTPDLRKTQLCKAFLEGKCQNKNCDFAHADTELRSTDVFFKKTLCIWNEKGKCRNGSECRFAHGITDLRSEHTMRLAELGLGAEALPEGQAQKSKSMSRKGKKSTGSSCSSVSFQSGGSTTSGSSDGPSGSGGGSGNTSGSSGSNCNRDSSGSGSCLTASQSEPMKVLQFDANPLARVDDLVANRPSHQGHLASSISSQPRLVNTPQQPLPEALEALQNEIHSLNASQLEALANASYQNPQSSLHMELDVLRQATALLTTQCVRLQERAGVAGLAGLSTMDDQTLGGHGLNQNLGPFGFHAQSPQLPFQVAYSGLNYSVGSPISQGAHFGQDFGASGGEFQDPLANSGFFF